MDPSELEAQPPTTGKTSRKRAPSKRRDWRPATFYVKEETLAQLRWVVGLRKLKGQGGDLSDAVEEALQAWLSSQDQA